MSIERDSEDWLTVTNEAKPGARSDGKAQTPVAPQGAGPVLNLDDEAVRSTDAIVGRRLRLRREMLGLRQVDLAGLCNMSPQQIHKYENGDSRASSTRLVQLAKVLDVRVGWLFGEDTITSDEPNAFISLLYERVHLEILCNLERITSPKRKELIAQVVRTLSEDVLAEHNPSPPFTGSGSTKPQQD